LSQEGEVEKGEPKMTTVDRRGWLALLNNSRNEMAGAWGVEPGPDSSSSREMIRQRYFPNIGLVTHEGKRVRFYDDLIKDKIVVINMMYADCEGVCPGITSNLVSVQKILGDRVGRDIFIYSITLKPEQDTPKVLKDYSKMHGTQPGWWFLTGKPGDTELLRRKLGFVDPDPDIDKDKSQHIGNIRYGNEALQQWAACPGLARPEWIVESILWVDWPKHSAAASITGR
jgi:protein SCO1